MAALQQYFDLHNFMPAENRRFAPSNFTKLVYTNARFEGVNTTLSQTQTIMDGHERCRCASGRCFDNC